MSVLFDLGQLVAAAGVAEAMSSCAAFANFVFDCLKRYCQGDWGEMEQGDIDMNNESVALDDGRVLASYDMPADIPIDYADKIWIITEADRSVTTVLFPDEY